MTACSSECARRLSLEMPVRAGLADGLRGVLAGLCEASRGLWLVFGVISPVAFHLSANGN